MELISKATVMCTKIVSPNQVLFVGSGDYNLGIPLEPLLNLLQSGKKEQNQKLNIQKTKIMASGPITSWQINGETKETEILIFGAPKSLQMMTAAMKLKDVCFLEENL